MGKRWEGVGVTPRDLTAGAVVMVPAGQVSAAANGGPCIIAWAVVVGPDDYDDAVGPKAKWWLDVYTGGPGAPPLPQAYRAEEILGVPALGLSHEGAPPRPA